ncbi:MAG: class F sortase [Acidimicrobiales bacterium]
MAAAVLILGGGSAVGVAAASQQHAPQPTARAAGTTGPRPSPAGAADKSSGAPTPTTSPGGAVSPSTGDAATSTGPPVVGPTLPASDPVSIDIPAISVQSNLQHLGLNPDGTIQVPQPGPAYNEAAWYDGSPAPGTEGPSVIEGHIDSAATGPSVFFRLGALGPGDPVDVTLADGTVAVFTVTGVRQYPKASFPTATVYGNTDFAALRLITCGGSFDGTTGHYVANTVVFASLSSSHPAGAA